MTDHQLLRRLIRETLLLEGAYDPGLLKAIFMAGGPGSGKTYTAKTIFGADPKSFYQTATASGLKIVNSDPAFEYFLEKAGVDPGSLATMSEEEWAKHTVGPESERGRSKRVRDAARAGLIGGRVGVLLDGTGDDYKKIVRKKKEMEALGYDTYMLFVNTTLDVAQERNMERKRKLKPSAVEEVWVNVQANLGDFQGLFGQEDIVIVDNTEYGPIKDTVQKAIDRWMAEPIENPIGRRWVETELAYKEHEFGKEDIEKKAPGVVQRTLGHGGRAPGHPGAGVRGVSSTHEPISDAELERMKKAQKIKGI